MFTRFLGGAILNLLLFVSSFATVYYVSIEGDNGNNGLSPDSAWRNVSYATQQVGNSPGDPDTVFVYPGLYDSGAGETFPIDVRSYTSLIGLDSIANLWGDGYEEPVLRIALEMNTSIDNFEIANGGGGIEVKRCSSLVISGNYIHDNKRYGTTQERYGGGITIEECKQITISDNIISSNELLVEGHSYDAGGGGLGLLESLEITIQDNSIISNIARTPGDAQGGGMYVSGGDSVYIIGNVIEDNLASGTHRSRPKAYGGGIYLGLCGETCIRGNIISGNTVDAYAQEDCEAWGGGIYLRGCVGDVSLTSNVISDNEAYSQCRFAYYEGGGGVRVEDCFTTFTSNIIVGNNARIGGGINAVGSSSCLLLRNQIYGNTAYAGGGISAGYNVPITIGGAPGLGNDIYDDTAYTHGSELYTVEGVYKIATFNYFGGEPNSQKVYPFDSWDSRHWRHNPIGENEPPHIVDYVPTCAETTVNIGDTLLFWVDVLDYDGDTTSTWWLLNGTQVADGDSFLFIADSQYAGYDTIQAAVTDYIDTTTQDWLVFVGQTGVTSEERERNLPRQFVLRDNYPNPFNASTIIRYELPRDCHVCLEIFDISGRKVGTLVDEKQKAGYKIAIWNAKTAATGFYFYKLTAGDFSETKKMIILR